MKQFCDICRQHFEEKFNSYINACSPCVRFIENSGLTYSYGNHIIERIFFKTANNIMVDFTYNWPYSSLLNNTIRFSKISDSEVKYVEIGRLDLMPLNKETIDFINNNIEMILTFS